MPTLHVRSFPEELCTHLKQRAQMHQRSLSAEVIALLEWALEEAEHASEALPVESIRRRRFFDPASAGAPDSTSLLRADRER
jgi:plasmid stability protein